MGPAPGSQPAPGPMRLQESAGPHSPRNQESGISGACLTHHGVHALAEEVHVELLKAGAGDGGVEVDALVERVELDAGLRRRRQRALGALAGGAQAAERAGVVADVLLVLALELL